MILTKKIVSIALFGEGEKLEHYGRFLPTFALAHANLFPESEGWVLELHLDVKLAGSYYARLAYELEDRGILTWQFMTTAPLTQAMLWRMRPVFDKGNDFVFCRDLDALPTPRERTVCDQFMKSGCYLHTILDNRLHVGVMGGLCGFHAPSFREVTGWRTLADLYAAAGPSAWATHGTDQTVLNRLLLSNPAMRLLEHRFNGWHGGPGKFRPHEAASYACQAWSMPIPDGLESQREADMLANHMGAAGYGIDKARAYWDEKGCPATAGVIRDAEAAVRA